MSGVGETLPNFAYQWNHFSRSSRRGGWRTFKRHQGEDWEIAISQAEKHPSITYLINFTRKNSWMRIWNNILDRGPVGTSRALAVLKLLFAPVYCDRRCSLPRSHLPVENTDTMIDHFLKNHPDIAPFPDSDTFLKEICSAPDSFSDLGQSLLSALQWTSSLVPRPLPSFPSLAVR